MVKVSIFTVALNIVLLIVTVQTQKEERANLLLL